MSLDRYVDLFLQMMRVEKRASVSTINCYKTDIHQMLTICADITSNGNIEKYLQNLYGAGYSSRTISRKLIVIKCFFKFLIIEKVLLHSPLDEIKNPKTDAKIPEFISVVDMDKILSTAKEDRSYKGIKFYTMLEVLYASGIRVSELVALQLQDLERVHEGSYLYACVRGKGNKERIVPLTYNAHNALEIYISRYLPKDSKWLFPGSKRGMHMTRQRVGQLLKRLAIKSDINPEKVYPHVFRHSFATHLLNNDMDIKVLKHLLGHKNITTTQIYTKVSCERLKDKVMTYHPLYREEM